MEEKLGINVVNKASEVLEELSKIWAYALTLALDSEYVRMTMEEK